MTSIQCTNFEEEFPTRAAEFEMAMTNQTQPAQQQGGEIEIKYNGTDDNEASMHVTTTHTRIQDIVIDIQGKHKDWAASSESALHCMTAYNCSSDAPCVPGDALVLCRDGKSRRVDSLRVGDYVATGTGRGSIYGHGNSHSSCALGALGEIDTIVRTNCQEGKHDLVVLTKSGLRVTPWHPIRVRGQGQGQNQWTFPYSLTLNVEEGEGTETGTLIENATCETVFSFLLKKNSPTPLPCSMIINGVECITLGHGILGDNVASHPFYGTDAIRKNLADLHTDYKSGMVILEGGHCVKRNRKTGLACRLYQYPHDSDKFVTPRSPTRLLRHEVRSVIDSPTDNE